MRINKYLPLAFIYFFINSVALPFGLTFTAILSPVFYWWILKERKKDVLLPFFACLSPFLIIHFLNGVDARVYITSILNYSAVYIFCQAFYTFLKVAEDPEKIFRKILWINFVLCLLAIPIYFTSYSDLLWSDQALTEGIDNFKRLRLFTYEASYYATLFTPLFFFYFVQIILHQNKMNTWLLLLMILLPFILSFSIGVISAVLFSIVLTYIIYFGRLTRKKRVLSMLLIFGFTTAAVVTILVLFFPGNTIFVRVENIFLGTDTSGKGRTSDAFILAWDIMKQKSLIWGVGAGQIKVLGGDIIRSYYLYALDYDKIAIPNAAAETLAIFGYVGLGIRVLIELFFFFYTRVWNNYYRLLLFLFIFLYQFTGSFITNIAEYVIWILAFTNVFSSFDSKDLMVIRNNKSSLS
ncbi:MAG: hypothetical protein ABIO04_13600 [Ferruginibacter sp.]